jgi:outer membrane lipoprotein-sorting protein
LLVVLSLEAQHPDAIAILRRVTQKYQKTNSFRFNATLSLHMRANGMRLEMSVSGARMRPGKARLDVHHPMMSSRIVADGRHVWKYVTTYGQFTKRAASPGAFSGLDGMADILAGEHVLDRLRNATLVRRDVLPVGDDNIECDVIEAEYEPKAGNQFRAEGPKTLWVDKSRSVILKTSQTVKMSSRGPVEMIQTVTVTSLQIHVRLSESLFVFSPPPGAQEVSEFTPGLAAFRGVRK